MPKRFKDFIEDVSKPGKQKELHDFYAIVSQPDYTDSALRAFFGELGYQPTNKEYRKISDLHDHVEDKFDCEYRDY
jgi:hypothetical protein